MTNLSLGLSSWAVGDGIASLEGKTHPLTGEPLRPLGFRSDGRAIWPIMGGAPGDDEDEDETDDDDTDTGDDDDADEDPDDDDDAEDKAKKKDPADRLKAKNKELIGEKRKAQRERDEAQRELQKIKDKDKPEVDRLKTENAELTKSNEGLQSDLRNAQLENAFLKDNSYNWHNPGRALKLVDLSDVEIDDETGEVTGLTEALDTLAKDEPYLVKSDDDDDDDTETKRKKEPVKTGTRPKSRKQKMTDEEQRKADRAKYPGLNR